MRILIIISQICILYLFYFIGTMVHNAFHLVIPGSIIGLIFLFIGLWIKVIPEKFIKDGAGFLLSILILFFIPATVGIMNYASLLSIHGALIALAILSSTALTIIIAGKAGQFFEHKAQKRKEEKRCSNYSRSV